MARCILFDIDNTLLFKKPSIPEKVFETAASCLPGLDMEEVERAYAQSELWQGGQIQKENETGVRMPDEEYLENIFLIYRRTLGLPEEMYGALRDVFMRNYFMEYEPAPGAVETLRRIKLSGLKLGIVSNNTTEVRAALDKHGLSGFFDCTVISEEVNLYKPDPDILELACRQAGVACGESIYAGDHPFDILCAHSAHMPAIWMPVNRFMTIPEHIGPPEYTVNTLAEVINVLGL